MTVETRWGDPGTPGSEQERAWRRANIVTIRVGGIALAVHRELAVIFTTLVAEIVALGYADLAKVADDWGFANRPIRGRATGKSFHATGQAIDLDATTNPLGVRRTTFPVAQVRALCRRLGLRWGFDYTGRPDSMHFEFIHGVAEARRITAALQRPPATVRATSAVRRVVRAGKTNPYPQPASPVGPGGVGRAVQWVQWALGLKTTARFGALEVRAVRAFQAKQRLTVDGIVGPKTRAALAKVTR